jgi:large subunit ribosomal protein L1
MKNKASKRVKELQKKVVHGKPYPLINAFTLVKETATAKFDESVDLSIRLGIDARKENVRGATVLPNGTGKKVRVAVVAQAEAQVEAAKAAGADIVGFDDLAEKIKGGEIEFDVLIATPDSMRIVGQLGQILGPRGLMPNPKVGTVSADVGSAVKNAKSGQVRYKTDKAGIVHVSIGKASFSEQSLAENFYAVMADIKKLKPVTAKGVYIKKVSVSSTMGQGVLVEATVV